MDNLWSSKTFHNIGGLYCKAVLKSQVCPPATENNMTCGNTEHSRHSLNSQEGQELATNMVLFRNLQTCFFPVRLHKMLQRYLNLTDLILEVIYSSVLMNTLYFPVPKITKNWKKLQEKAQCTACYFVLVSANVDNVLHSTLHRTVYCPAYLYLRNVPENVYYTWNI